MPVNIKKGSIWEAVSLFSLLACREVGRVTFSSCRWGRGGGEEGEEGVKEDKDLAGPRFSWKKATRRPLRVSCDGSAPTIVRVEGREFLFRLVFAIWENINRDRRKCPDSERKQKQCGCWLERTKRGSFSVLFLKSNTRTASIETDCYLHLWQKIHTFLMLYVLKKRPYQEYPHRLIDQLSCNLRITDRLITSADHFWFYSWKCNDHSPPRSIFQLKTRSAVSLRNRKLLNESLIISRSIPLTALRGVNQ